MQHRTEIDGLRAVAVIPVILYHANIDAFSGGYVGVDIFFVISGYLITNILLSDIKRDDFSLKKFYEKRIRRIFPALFTVLATSSCVALWILFDSELESYSRSLLASTLFYSNYNFMFDTGYFAAPAENKPLLHTWSLAVEEQFYIVFPILFYVAYRYFYKKILILILSLFASSFLYSSVIAYTSPEIAFFSTPARAWELLTGAILALFPKKNPINSRTANIITSIGMSAILCSIFFFSKDTPFPGPMALLPVIGSALIIQYTDSNNNIVGNILSKPILRIPGLLSYSLYLWHWPIFVYYKIYKIEPITKNEVIILIIITFVLSYLSWKYIETPYRQKRIIPAKKIIFHSSIALTLSVTMAIVILANNGIPGRQPVEVNKLLEAKTDINENNDCEDIKTTSDRSLRFCNIGSKQEKTTSFIVWGDSHGKAILPAIDKSAKHNNIKGIFVGRGGCLSLLDAHQVRKGFDKCKDIASNLIEFLSGQPDIKKIILVSRWAIYSEGVRFKNEKGHTVYIRDQFTNSLSLDENRKVFERSMNRTLNKLSQLDKDIIIVSQVPETEWDIPIETARAEILNHNIEFRPKLSDYLDRQKFPTDVFKKFSEEYSIILIEPYKKICENIYCLINKNDRPIYRDTNHITKSYAESISDLFDPLFQISN